MKPKPWLFIFALLLVSCGTEVRTVAVHDNCTVDQTAPHEAVITCPDGSSVDLNFNDGTVACNPAPEASPSPQVTPSATPSPSPTPSPGHHHGHHHQDKRS